MLSLLYFDNEEEKHRWTITEDDENVLVDLCAVMSVLEAGCPTLGADGLTGAIVPFVFGAMFKKLNEITSCLATKKVV